MTNVGETTPRRNWPAIVFLVCLVFLLWVIVPFGMSRVFDSWEERGQFGDTFGAVNALFTGLAFAFLIVSVRLQSNELALQRRELQLQREEMKETRKELSAQANAQTLQLHAAIAQLYIAAAQTEIEALKIEAESKGPSARASFGQDIRTVGAEMRKRAEKLQELASKPIHGARTAGE